MKVSSQQVLIAAICAVIALTVVPRFLYLGRFLTADEKRWQANVAGFTRKLSHGQLSQLLQQPHPGITTQWFAAATIPSQDWGIRKIPLVLWQCVLLTAIAYTCWRLLGPWPAIALAAALATDPMLVAHTRIYAMDSLLAQFTLLSLFLLLLAEKTKQPRYFLFAGAAAAAAFLSKLPGILLIPTSLAYIAAIYYQQPKVAGKHMLWWIAGLIIAASLILPALAIHPLATMGDFAEFFRSDDYTELHQASNFYYLSTLFYLASPFQWLLVPIAICLLFKKDSQRRQIALLLIFAIVFMCMMSAGTKKGDRYILPAIVVLDGLIAFIVMWIQKHLHQTSIKKIGVALVLLFLWQVIDVIRLTPYTLAYVNPITKPWLGDRRLGWGEGLDIAAEYLNTKPDSQTLKVAVNYPVEFGYHFKGEAVALNRWDNGSINYVVIYRTSFERGPNSWEQDVLNHFKDKTPEKVIKLNNIPYAWIYKLK